ncbi:MAG: glycosyltransferase family 2 protein [Endomicrobium sp.]|jgi:glycosyltransferase involved in cell wall biosynthesis|nr:glycosyltransferase family 2 protein [Endomicrobium sp.]
MKKENILLTHSSLPTLSIVVPCFNEEEMLSLFYTEMMKVMLLLSESVKDFNFEFIFVDDGSIDASLDVLRNFTEQDNSVHYVSFSRNFGKEAAILAGLQKSQGQYIVVLDADLQNPPSMIVQMFKAVVFGGYDCAGTRRVTRKGEPYIRSFFARLFYKIMVKISDVQIVDGACDFRLMSRKYVDAVLLLSERNRFSKGIFPWVGFKTKWFEYENIERVAGVTKWSFLKLFFYSLDGIIAFSSKPLALASIFGMILFLGTLLFMGIVVIRKIIYGDSVTGWASIVCIILFCSSVQLFTTGILGQYLAKTYTEVKRRPYYVIKEEK